MSAEFAVVRACPFCNVVPDVEGTETPVAVHFCKADRNNLMVVKMSLWQQRPVEDALKKEVCDAVADERSKNYPLIDALEKAGMGQPGTPNTFWAMVHEICEKSESCQSRLTALDDEVKFLNEITLELSSLNRTLQASKGDMPEKSVLNFTSEVARLAGNLFDLIHLSRSALQINVE